ncbi:uncharacterized protein TNCV_3343801 [Trichonephila clavipes]|nr:uncharacterized protein TNCV_3343801 [Trichonephila clavipes]
MFSSTDRVTAQIRKLFQQLQIPAKKYASLRPKGILSKDDINLDQPPQDINKEEFQLVRVRVQAFVAATYPGCKKNSLGPTLWVYCCCRVYYWDTYEI